MLTLKVEVPEARDRTAFATLREGMRTIASGPAIASATQAFAARHANPQCDPLRLCGHAPLGRYRLLHHEAAGPGQSAHYGARILVFEPQSGPALDAETFGRLGLLVFGGPPGRRTQGGVRLSNELMNALLTRLSPSADMTLDLVPLRARAWWQFWKTPHPPSQPLAGDPLNPPQAPHDELTLLEALLQRAPPRTRNRSEPDHDSDSDRDRQDRSSSSSSGEAFQGKGGQSGGAGASGRWDEAGKGSGVDSAGRIVGVAAAVGAVGAVAAVAAMAGHSGTAEGAGAAPSDGGGADDGSGASTDTTTSTAY